MNHMFEKKGDDAVETLVQMCIRDSRIPCALGLLIAAVYMYGGIHQLAGSLIDSVRLGDNPHILSLGISRLHASYIGQLQPAVFLNLGNQDVYKRQG